MRDQILINLKRADPPTGLPVRNNSRNPIRDSSNYGQYESYTFNSAKQSQNVLASIAVHLSIPFYGILERCVIGNILRKDKTESQTKHFSNDRTLPSCDFEGLASFSRTYKTNQDCMSSSPSKICSCQGKNRP